MSIFRNSDDYEEIFDASTDPYDPDEDYTEYDAEDAIESLRGTISEGDCYYCGATNSMKALGESCFYCEKCKKGMEYDSYLRWYAGYSVETEE